MDDAMNDIFIIPISVLEDRTLSAEALGVLCFLAAQPHGWEFSIASLAKRFHCGLDRIYRIIRELDSAGYAHRSAIRDSGQKFVAHAITVNVGGSR